MKGDSILYKYECNVKYSKKYCKDNDPIKASWRDTQQPPTIIFKNGPAVLPRDSTPFKYLRLQSPLIPHGCVTFNGTMDVLRRSSTANSSSADDQKSSSNVIGQHGDSSSPKQINHVFINTYWGWIYIGCPPHP